MCASCKARLLEGEVEMEKNYALVDTDLEQGIDPHLPEPPAHRPRRPGLRRMTVQTADGGRRTAESYSVSRVERKGPAAPFFLSPRRGEGPRCGSSG